MYSGTTLTKASGRLLGAHQKIDRVARNHLTKILDDDRIFPKSSKILQFEGKNGPDGLKRKSPALDEPWHFYSPFDDEDSVLLELIKGHYDKLVKELKDNNPERIAFEAAWLAHALVDGLTPAHHYPYEQKLEELRGDSLESRDSLKHKIVQPGDNRREKLKNNWKMWGPRGLITAHGFFEFGVASVIAPLGFGEAVPTDNDIQKIKDLGVLEYFKNAAKEIGVLGMYDRYRYRGWTPKLAWQVRHKLGPTIVQTVTLSWYLALFDAGLIKK